MQTPIAPAPVPAPVAPVAPVAHVREPVVSALARTQAAITSFPDVALVRPAFCMD